MVVPSFPVVQVSEQAPLIVDPTRAEALLRGMSVRVTQPRVQVLALLIGSEAPLTHHEVMSRIQAAQPVPDGQTEAEAPMDRVTIYRVLDWLVERGLVRKSAGADRVYRFHLAEREAAQEQAHRSHSHFYCTQCQRMFCLDDEALPGSRRVVGASGVWRRRSAASPVLPEGFSADHIELTVKGRCADCNQPAGVDGSQTS